MPELNFAFYRKVEVCVASHATGFLSQCQSCPWYRNNWFSITLAVLSEESLAQASVQALDLDGLQSLSKTCIPMQFAVADLEGFW